MFRCYQFNPTIKEIEILNNYSEESEYTKNSDYAKGELKKLLISKESIDADKLQCDWFPKIDSKIFLSHSHKDEKLAIEFSNYLKEKLGETSFIDSCVWGNISDLLKELDNVYCINKDKKTYNYNKRNVTTSHSYMILNTALEKQIDKCDCIIFINTDNSIIKKENERLLVTDSPWIYSELIFADYCRIKQPKDYVPLNESKNELYHSKKLEINYKLDLKNFDKINLDLIKRISTISKLSGDAMINLYQYMDNIKKR